MIEKTVLLGPGVGGDIRPEVNKEKNEVLLRKV